MRFRVALISLVLASTAVAVPLAAHAQAIPFFGPIIDDKAMQTCALGWGAVILVINNIIRLLLTLLIVFVAPLMIAWAGFLLVVNSVNPHGKEEAKKMILNLIVGLVVALCAWLIVDLIMAVLYNPSAKGLGAQWYEIITTGGSPTCIPLAEQLNQAPPGAVGTTPSGGTSGGGTGGVSAGTGGIGVPTSPPALGAISSACSTAALTPIFGANAAAMSCATRYENAPCNPGEPSGTDRAATGEPLSVGLFQVNLTTNNLNYPECTIAAGANSSLNCTRAFSGPLINANTSIVRIVNPQLYTSCLTAASDITCNLAAAKNAFDDRISRGQNPLSAWGTAAKNNCSSLLPITFSPWHQFLAMVWLPQVL